MSEILVQGPIRPEFVAEKLSQLESLTNTGANSFFLGRVRADELGETAVMGIDYTAYPRMAALVSGEIAAEAIEKFGVQAVDIFHSTGMVKVGEVSLLVLISSAHRQPSFEALKYAVDELKARFPAWKKEVFSDGSHRWIGEPGSG